MTPSEKEGFSIYVGAVIVTSLFILIGAIMHYTSVKIESLIDDECIEQSHTWENGATVTESFCPSTIDEYNESTK